MASTYTTSLNLELQASGENSGTWGTKTNTNISLLETAICGGSSSSLAITATSQSLTAADGSADQARRAVLKLTGTLTGNTTLSSEAVEKIYWVDNQTTMSTYTLTLAPAGGSGVSLASGRKHLIFQDGTNAYDPLADYGPINSSSLVSGGNMTVGSGTDGTDYTLTFDGHAGDGVITWMEDEDYFALSDDILMNTNEKVQFRDTGLYISSNADGDLDIVSDGTAVDSINLESAGGVTLDAGTAGSGIVYEDDGTEMLRIHNSSSDVYLESKVSDKDIYIKGNDGGSSVQAAKFDMSEGGTLTLGGGVDGVDYSITFDGNAADGVVSWMEDEDYFKFSDDVLMNSTERLNFGDTGTYIFQSADGVLDLVSDSEVEINGTTIDINGATDVSGTLTLGTVAAAGSDTDKFLVLDGSGNVDYRTGTQVLSDIGAGSSSVALTGSTDNTLVTVTGSDAIAGEANFTFDATDALIAGAGKLQLRDTGLFVNSSTDGQLDIDADTTLELTAPTIELAGATKIDLQGDAVSIGENGDTDVAITFNANDNDGVLTWMEDEDYFKFSDEVLMNSTEKLLFRDTALAINSSTDGQLDIDADTELEITAPTVDIDASSGVDISTDLTIGDDLLFGSSGAVINFNSGDVTLTHGSNLLTLDGGALDLDGEELVLDPDGDTSITADSDDQIDIKIAGADDFQFTANTFTIPSGSTVAIAAGGAITNAGTMAPAISSTGKVLALGI